MSEDDVTSAIYLQAHLQLVISEIKAADRLYGELFPDTARPADAPRSLLLADAITYIERVAAGVKARLRTALEMTDGD
jgi:hypothetical protein